MLAGIIFFPLAPSLLHLLPAKEKAEPSPQHGPYQGRRRTHPDVARHMARVEQPGTTRTQTHKTVRASACLSERGGGLRAVRGLGREG